MLSCHRVIPKDYAESFCKNGLYFSPCRSFVDMLEFRLGHCYFEGCEAWDELRKCVENTFRDPSVNAFIDSAGVSCWREGSADVPWVWSVYGHDEDAFQVTIDGDDMMDWVKRSGRAGVIGPVHYGTLVDAPFSGVRPEFLFPFNLSDQQAEEPYHLFFLKHPFYRYEKELRIMVVDQKPQFLALPDGLIRGVTLSPGVRAGSSLDRLLRSRFGEKVSAS